MGAPMLKRGITRGQRSALVTRAAAQASRELVTLHDQLEQRALDVCVALRDARTRDERDTAIAIACAIADEAQR